MPLLFRTMPGALVRLNDPAVQCGVKMFKLNPGITFEAENSIVTRLTVSQQVNIQFLHTMGSHVYVYVFGDRIGNISLSGLSFSCNCTYNSDVHGAGRLIAWYKRYRASKRREPVQVTIGDQAIDGFIVGMTEDVVDPMIGLVQWGINLVTLPED